jgi:SAM-dependent methyltransferase/uncharacterized OsmC-like protein
MHNINVEAVRKTITAAELDPAAAVQTVGFSGEWQTEEGEVQFRTEIPLPDGSSIDFECDYPPHMGGTGRAPNPLAYCFWGGLACFAMTYAQEAAVRGVEIRSLRARVSTELDMSRALGVSERPPVEGIDWFLEVDADASPEVLAEIKSDSDERCPGAYCISNPIELNTHLEVVSAPSDVEVERQADRAHGSGLSARLYDPILWWGERGGLSRKRERLLGKARGEVLEIGAGTGLNLAHYPAGLDRLVLTEPEEHKAALLLKKAAALDLEAEFVRASAEAVPFDDDSFDTVVATLVFCTVADPEQAISELRRVLRPGGVWLFIEHIRSDRPFIGSLQDRLRRPWARLADGCQCNRQTISMIEAEGFEVEITSVADKALMPPVARPIVAGLARIS